jgi:hypothetical protein
MLSIVPRISAILATLTLGACSASPVPVGENTGALGSSGNDGGSSSGSGDSQGPCASAPVPAIACATAPTVHTCDTGTTPPSWDVTCMGSSGSSSSKPENLCGDLPVDLLGCASGQPLYTCDGAGAAPHWAVTCPGAPVGDASPSHPEQPLDSGSTACDGLAVETIGCASGQPVTTCDVSSGAPHWVVTCP